MLQVVGVFLLRTALMLSADREVLAVKVELNVLRIHSRYGNTQAVLLFLVVYPGLDGGTAKISRAEGSSLEAE